MKCMQPCRISLLLIWQNFSKADVTLTDCLLCSRLMWVDWLMNLSRLAMSSSQKNGNLHDAHPALRTVFSASPPYHP